MKQSSKHGSDAAGDGDSDTGHDEADDDVPSLKRSRSAVAVNPEEVSSDEDDIPVRSSALKRRQVFRRPSSPVQVNSDSDEEEVEEEDDSDVPRSARRRGTRLSKQPRPSLRELWEEADLAEDLEFLESSPPPAPHSRGARSSQATPKKSKKLSALEELRRRRQRQIEPSANLPVPLVDEDEDEGLEEEEDAEIVDYNGEDDVDEEDFIVEDDPDDPLGAPEMPLQFTRMGTAKAKDLFQHAVAWMVHKKLNARFRMDDEIYQLTFRKLSDEVKGLAGSKFMSSIWRPDFTRALRSRPGIIMENVGIEAMAHCEACNRKSHPATWTVRFEGKPYDPETLDELYLKDSSSSSEDDEEGSNEQRKMKARGPDYDAQGNELPPERKLFYVGVHCKANATTAHTLTHWKIHLYEWVVDYLAQKGHLAAEKIVDRDSWSDRKKEKFANRVAKGMVDDGEVKRLYRDFHHNVDDARDAKQQYGRWGH
ncbi:hypothetical protein P152DRAFT_464923 [Eremomyces bilateralis CBS 781.70]|uniref:DUF4211 domain-containing protein n=1 Tax=Eremomyces bilateralis CBS 781.70 TaxID=1392243 RepID=A0A6G1GAL1_9PEZI|nr:uncharacterized protein P152DRAFT_464923 [Eremomyces bilateralis CBS 781.70]KAF1815064.1 hypothetical protein P152DRAFT_464923 [Eremomyces bilateralis CBS 781.70]